MLLGKKHLERKLCNRRCSAHSYWFTEFAATLDPRWVKVEELLGGIFSSIIFPKALLERNDVHVDIIFPSLDLLNAGFDLCTHKPESNKQLFEDLFGWKKENTIKGVFLISKCAPGEQSEDIAIRRAKEICRLIKSLPEAQKIPICVTVNSDNGFCSPRMYGGQNGTTESWSLQYPATEPSVDNLPKSDTSVSFGGPVTLIVFGGEAVEATAYFVKKTEEIDLNPRFSHWKNAEYESVSKAKEVIGFYVRQRNLRENSGTLWEQLVIDGQWIQLPRNHKIIGIAKPQTIVEEAFAEGEQDDCDGFFVVGFQ